ncbi:MAG TPA: nuclear transport factor 2 family protein [Candidatus Omnitrophota bacterium]|nr:nuclear transport factor 2 family protein [Candidatus Omnitrophota bacterium]
MMKKQMVWLFMFLLAGTSFCFTNPAFAENDPADAVQAAADQFYVALNAMFTGDSEPMKAVWSHADDVTYMGPAGGFQKGWLNILPIWEETAAMKLGGKVTPEHMQMTLGQDVAITHNYEVGENFDQDGNLQQVSIRATNIFRKEDGEWKMIGHHTDLLPYLEKQTAQ